MCSSDVDIGGLDCSNETRMQRPVRIRFRKSISIFNFSRGRSELDIPLTYSFFQHAAFHTICINEPS